MSSYDGVKVSRIDDAIMLVKLNRPPHNFLELPLLSGIADAYEEFAASPDARVIVLSAEGKNFCAGGNFSAWRDSGSATEAPEQSRTQFSSEDAYAQGVRLMAAPLPVVAAIRGAAVGGGLGLALTADFRVGSAETRLVPNFSQLGIHHGFGLTVTLPLLVGTQRANELLLTGRRVRGEEGYRIGLLDRFVEEDELETAAIEFAREIASSAPLAI